MELTSLVQTYVKTRDDFVGRIALITQQLNVWTEEHSKTPPSLTDIAQFEGLRAERSHLLSEFTETEDQFVVHMLQTLSSSVRHTAG